MTVNKGPDNLLVNRRWTDSICLLEVCRYGDQTQEQYSSRGRTCFESFN